MEQAGWILLIYAFGLAAMTAELFMPEFILGTIGFCMVVVSVLFAVFTGEHTLAGVLVAVTLVFFPLFFLLWKNLLGRMLSAPETLKDFRSSSDDYESLLGEEGMTLSALRPSGAASVKGKRYAVTTRGEMIDRGTRVRVIAVSGARLVVKRAGREGGA